MPSPSYACDFHREQAWEQWVQDHKHGLTKDEGEELLQLLWACAGAESSDPSIGYPDDHSFQEKVKELKASPMWENNNVKQWLSTKWLCCAKVTYTCTLHKATAYTERQYKESLYIPVPKSK